MPGLHRPRGARIPLGCGTGVVGHRSLAAQFEQAPAIARALVIKGLRKLALVVKRASITAVVDGFAIEGLGSSQAVQFGQAAKRDEMGQHTGHHHRYRRASRHMDNRLVLDDVRHRHGPRRIRIGTGEPTEGRAGPHGNNRRSASGCLFQQIQVGPASDAGIRAVLPHGDGAIDDQQVLALVFFHRGVQGLLGLETRGGHQRLLVVQ